MRKPAFCICKNKGTDQLGGYHTANQCMDGTIPLLSKFQAYSHFQWLYRPVCAGPGQKLPGQVF